MPLIIISGYPSSGKTYRSCQLLSYLNEKISTSTDSSHGRLNVVHINDQSLGLCRDIYAEARTEKDARAAEYSAVKRAIGRDTIVIADGMNYIKGFRYQLYCEAKALQTPSCVIHVGTSIDKCRDINSQLLADNSKDGGYSEEVFENLVYRYEEPNGMTRWDSPLFTVPYDDEEPPYEAIWEAIVGKVGEKKVVKPNQATVLQPASAPDYLQTLDRTTQGILNAILSYQKDHPSEGGGSVALEEGVIELPATPVTVPQLQRIRRQFTTLMRTQRLEEGRLREGFVAFLNDGFQ
ncbi:MAG: hypothetical protein MMC33_007923 [Icmadophila ericetorum]|nr:hypothetical protein [Icmadophila ericetorum]